MSTVGGERILRIRSNRTERADDPSSPKHLEKLPDELLSGIAERTTPSGRKAFSATSRRMRRISVALCYFTLIRRASPWLNVLPQMPLLFECIDQDAWDIAKLEGLGLSSDNVRHTVLQAFRRVKVKLDTHTGTRNLERADEAKFREILNLLGQTSSRTKLHININLALVNVSPQSLEMSPDGTLAVKHAALKLRDAEERLAKLLAQAHGRHLSIVISGGMMSREAFSSQKRESLERQLSLLAAADVHLDNITVEDYPDSEMPVSAFGSMLDRRGSAASLDLRGTWCLAPGVLQGRHDLTLDAFGSAAIANAAVTKVLEDNIGSLQKLSLRNYSIGGQPERPFRTIALPQLKSLSLSGIMCEMRHLGISMVDAPGLQRLALTTSERDWTHVVEGLSRYPSLKCVDISHQGTLTGSVTAVQNLIDYCASARCALSLNIGLKASDLPARDTMEILARYIAELHYSAGRGHEDGYTRGAIPRHNLVYPRLEELNCYCSLEDDPRLEVEHWDEIREFLRGNEFPNLRKITLHCHIPALTFVSDITMMLVRGAFPDLVELYWDPDPGDTIPYRTGLEWSCMQHLREVCRGREITLDLRLDENEDEEYDDYDDYDEDHDSASDASLYSGFGSPPEDQGYPFISGTFSPDPNEPDYSYGNVDGLPY